MFHLLFLAFAFVSLAQQTGQGAQQQLSQVFSTALKQCQECNQFATFVQSHPEFFEDKDMKNIKQWTLLVPNDNAMQSFRKQIDEMPREKLIHLFKMHVIQNVVPQFQDGMNLQTLAGTPLTVKKSGDQFTINDAKISGQCRKTPEGNCIYVIDKVLQASQQQPVQAGAQSQQQQDIWQLLQSKPEVSSFLNLVNSNPEFKQHLESMQTPFTLFVPNNKALETYQQVFSKLDKNVLKNLLMYHVIPRALTQLKDGENLQTLLTSDMISVRKQGEKFILSVAGQQAQGAQGAQPSTTPTSTEEVRVRGSYFPAKDQKGFYIINRVLIPASLKSQIQQLTQGQEQPRT